MNLAGVPSIVHALFGVGAFVLFAGMGRSLLAASCTLAVMTLPVIITSTREALAAVPMSFREACWNMGATRWQTIRTIVLPNSISGILTGVILQVSRAAGETAPILFTGAVFFMPVPDHGWQSFFPYGLGDRCMALSMHLFTLATQVRGVSDAVQYGTAVVLIGLVLAVNSLSIGLRVYLRVAEEVVACRWTTHIRFEHVTVALRRRRRRCTTSRLDIPDEADLRHHRAGQLRQDHAAEVHQPHDRLRARGHASAARCWSTARTSSQMRNVYELRRRIGMVFPLPVGLPLSVYENVAYAPRRAGMHDRARTRRAGRNNACARHALGRGEGPPRTCWAPSSPAASSSG